MNNLIPISQRGLPAQVSGGTPQIYSPQPPEVRKWVGVLLQRAGLGLAVAVGVFALVMAYTLTRPPLYTAFGSVLVDPQRENPAEGEPKQPQGMPDLNATDTQVELLRSRALAEDVARRMRLNQDPEFVGRRPSNGDEISPRLLDRVQNRIEIERTAGTYVVQVGFTSESPAKAAAVANEVMSSFLRRQLEGKVKAVEQANTELGAQLESMRREAETAEANVQQYKNAHGLFSAQGATMAEQEVSTLNQQIAAARADRMEKQARLSTAMAQLGAGGGGEDVGAALGSETIKVLRQKEAETSIRLAQLEADFKPEYPEVRRTRAQLENIRGAIQSEIRRILSSLRADAQAAMQREGSLLSSRGAAAGGLAANGQAQVGLVALQQRADSAKQIYEAYLNRAKTVAADGSLQQTDAAISTLAYAPTTPSSPNVPLMALLGGLLGLLCGAAAMLIAEFWGRSLRNGKDVERELGVRFAGVLPDYASVAGGRRNKSAGAAADYMVNQPLSAFAESLRNLRAFLRLSSPDNTGRLIAVTSAVPREGKSITSLCLARAIALSGSRVVVVDCDLRQRGLTRLIGDVDVGLVQVVEGKATLEQALMLDAKTGLWILPASTGDIPDDLFGQEATDRLFERLTKEFDCVLLDTPPVLGVADARMLAAKADRVLYAVHWNKTPVRAAQAAIDILRESGADIAGALLTRVDVKKQARFGYNDSSDYFHAYKSYYAKAV